jgi:hypothetical protein
MRFWNTLKNIVFRPDFFASATFTLKDGLKFYSLLLLLFIGLRILLALPNTVHLYQTVLSEQWQEQKNIIDDLYPDELKLTLKEGIVTTNVAQPYPLSLPEPWRSPKNNTPDNLLVINTDKPIETGDFVADCSEAHRLLEWKPKVSFDEGLKRTFAYYREHLSKYV